MTEYQMLIQAFDMAEPTTLHKVKQRLKISPLEKGEYIEGVLRWLVSAGILATPSRGAEHIVGYYALTAKGHSYALNKRCPLADSIQRQQLWPHADARSEAV